MSNYDNFDKYFDYEENYFTSTSRNNAGGSSNANKKATAGAHHKDLYSGVYIRKTIDAITNANAKKNAENLAKNSKRKNKNKNK